MTVLDKTPNAQWLSLAEAYYLICPVPPSCAHTHQLCNQCSRLYCFAHLIIPKEKHPPPFDMVRFLMKFNEGCRSLEPRARLDFLGPTPTPSSGAVANLLHSAGWPAKPRQVLSLSVKDGADECIGHFDGHYNRRVEREEREKPDSSFVSFSPPEKKSKDFGDAATLRPFYKTEKK